MAQCIPFLQVTGALKLTNTFNQTICFDDNVITSIGRGTEQGEQSSRYETRLWTFVPRICTFFDAIQNTMEPRLSCVPVVVFSQFKKNSGWGLNAQLYTWCIPSFLHQLFRSLQALIGVSFAARPRKIEISTNDSSICPRIWLCLGRSFVPLGFHPLKLLVGSLDLVCHALNLIFSFVDIIFVAVNSRDNGTHHMIEHPRIRPSLQNPFLI
mmetsp:Transcript_32702/g.68194  ORF Transcript_32702/g.68194 Transcript_32702/m.68194 type:complete len:211 (-) Transcript_32702:649-1281(-)